MDKTQGYVDNFVSSYNNLADSNFGTNPNFASIKLNLTLYHDAGTNFQVVVMQSEPNVTGFVTLVFIPIGGNNPIVVMDANDTFEGLYRIGCACEFGILEHLTFDFRNSVGFIKLAWSIKSNDITGDYALNSTIAARFLFEHDASRVSRPSPQPNPASQYPDPFGWFNDNPVVKAIGNVLSIALFGALTVTVVAVVISGKVREEGRKLLRMKKQPKHGSKNEKEAH